MSAKIQLHTSRLTDHPFQDEVAFFRHWFHLNGEDDPGLKELSSGTIVSCMKAYADQIRRDDGKELTVSDAKDIMDEVDRKWRKKIQAAIDDLGEDRYKPEDWPTVKEQNQIAVIRLKKLL